MLFNMYIFEKKKHQNNHYNFDLSFLMPNLRLRTYSILIVMEAVIRYDVQDFMKRKQFFILLTCCKTLFPSHDVYENTITSRTELGNQMRSSALLFY